MTPDQFWASTVAQLAALTPDTTVAPELGTADDLLALAAMA